MRIARQTLWSAGLILGLAVWTIYYLSRHWTEFSATFSWRPEVLAGLSVLVLAHFATLGLFNRQVLQSFGLTLTFKEWFGLSLLTTLGNYLVPPRGGAAIRAAYLKKRHDLPLSLFFSTFVAFNLFYLGGAGAAGLLGLAGLERVDSQAVTTLGLFLGVVLVSTIAVMILPLKPAWFEKPVLRHMGRMIEGWNRIRGQRRELAGLSLIVLANGLLFGLMLLWVFRGLGLPLSVSGAAVITSLMMLTSLVALTPGGLGIQEAVTVFTTTILGIQPAQSLAAVLTLRMVILFWTFLLGPLFSWLLIKKNGPPPSEPVEPAREES